MSLQIKPVVASSFQQRTNQNQGINFGAYKTSQLPDNGLVKELLVKAGYKGWPPGIFYTPKEIKGIKTAAEMDEMIVKNAKALPEEVLILLNDIEAAKNKIVEILKKD